ncbi:hypothetical protein WJX73_001486 [Symbiochloris irregularis]|uniref:Uncharacterized protein n=1 Tax=Symbiochloris irregularis TaxID=706552 RepID=A0AAW1PIW3_9CHLO
MLRLLAAGRTIQAGCFIGHSPGRIFNRRPSSVVPHVKDILRHSSKPRAFSHIMAFATTGGPVQFTPPSGAKWWSDATTAIVTGGNQGIGWEIARILSQQGIRTVLTSRDQKRGAEAVQRIKDISGDANIQSAQLELEKPKSVSAFAAWIKEKLPHVNILVNNAGMAYKGNTFGPEENRHTMNVNFFGTRALCEAILPLMEKGDRIVNVCSRAGLLSQLKSQALLDKFQAASTPDDITALANWWLEAVDNGTQAKQGFSNSMYGMSKLCEIAYTRVLAQQLASHGISVNAVCPGYVSTAMSSYKGTKHASEGADTPVWAALLLPNDVTGKFFAEREETSA